MTGIRDNYDDKAMKNFQTVKDWDTPERQGFIDRFESDTAFYFHQQLTYNEKKRRQEKKQLDIPIDRVRPIIRRIVSKIVRKRPSIAALAEDDRAIELSRRINAQWQYATKINKGLSQIRKALLNAVRGGLGFIYVYIDDVSRTGEKEVKYKYVSCKKIFVDPIVEDSLFDDGRGIALLDKVPLSDAIRMFADKQEEVIASANTSYQDEVIVDGDNSQGEIVVGRKIESIQNEEFEEDVEIVGWVEILTFWRKVLTPEYYQHIVDDNGNIMKHRISLNDYKKYKKMPDVKTEIVYKPALKEEVSTPFYMLREQIIDHDVQLLTPIIWEDAENAYPFSETFFIRGHQRLQNAYYMVLLENAQVSSFPTVWFETGVFVDKDEAMKQISTPGGAVELTRSAMKDGRIKWEHGKTLNQQFYQLNEQLKHEQEIQASAPSYQAGDSTQIPETNKALVNLDSFADRTLALNSDAIEAAIERVCYNVIKLQEKIYTDEKLLLIDTNPENNERLNQSEIDVESGRVVRKRIDDINEIEYDVALIPGSMSPLDRSIEYQLASAAAERGWVTPEFALRKMPLKGIDAEIQKMDTVKRQAEQLQKQQEVIEDMMKQMEEMTNKLSKEELGQINTEYRAKMEIELNKIKQITRDLNAQERTASRQNQIMKKQIQKESQKESIPNKQESKK